MKCNAYYEKNQKRIRCELLDLTTTPYCDILFS
nr:MAG TPA_asm: hypothetical protein [Caudoviricetes sp.]